MPLEIHLPQAALAEAVAMMWAWPDFHAGHAQERILPHGAMELTIDLTENPLDMWYTDGLTQQVCGPMLSGGRSTSFRIGTARGQSLLSVLFKPGAARMIFGIPATELHNQHLGLDALWGADAYRLYDRLLHAPSTAARFALLEAALCQRMMQAGPRHRAVDYALRAFKRDPVGGAIAPVVDAVGLSATRFIQVFRAETGMTPKRYTRLLRFQYALRQIINAEAATWADLALDCGYYDQAHFINDFQAFAGITPTQYAPTDPDHHLNLPVPEVEAVTG